MLVFAASSIPQFLFFFQFYWSLDRNASFTPGLFDVDWLTPNARKLEYINRLQPNPTKFEARDGWADAFVEHGRKLLNSVRYASRKAHFRSRTVNFLRLNYRRTQVQISIRKWSDSPLIKNLINKTNAGSNIAGERSIKSLKYGTYLSVIIRKDGSYGVVMVEHRSVRCEKWFIDEYPDKVGWILTFLH